MKVDVVVIGSGISGLTAASLLAKNGKRVALVEKQRDFGGSIRRFSRRGHSFDIGFHYTGSLGEGEFLQKLWRYCGIYDGLEIIGGSDAYDLFTSPNLPGEVRGFFSYELLEQELSIHFPAEQQAIKNYLQRVKESCSHIPFYHLDLPIQPFLESYQSDRTSLQTVLEEYFVEPRLRQILAAPSFLYGIPASEVAFDIHAMVAHGYYAGAYKVIGGGQAVVDAFISCLQQHRASLHANCEVVKVLLDGGEIVGVCMADETQIACDEVIFTGHPTHALDLLPPQQFRPAYRTRLNSLRNSLSMFAVYAKAEKKLAEAQGAFNHYQLSGDEDCAASTKPGERTLLLTTALAEKDEKEQLITLLRVGYWQETASFAGEFPRSKEYRQWKEQIGDEMIAQAEDEWGDIYGQFTPLAVATPLSFAHELSAPEGCTYGAMHSIDQYTPDVRTRQPGFYLSGQSTIMTGVIGASASAVVSAGTILGLENLWRSIGRG